MASRRRNRENANREGGADAVGEAFQQMAQGLLRVQEALRVQEQQAERRAQEALRLQEQRAATALREAVQRLERERDDAVRALREQLQGRIKKLEDRLDVVEEGLGASAERKGKTARGQRSVEHLETRMHKLEAGIERALRDVFPRVDSLVAQLEKPSVPRAYRAPPTASVCTPTVPTSASASISIPVRTPASTSITVLASDSVSISESASTSRRFTPSTSIPTCARNSTSNLTPASTSPSPRPPDASALEATANSEIDEGKSEEQQTERDEEWQEVGTRRKHRVNSPEETLCEAAHNGRWRDVRHLLDSGVDVNYIALNGETPLISVLKSDKPDPTIVSAMLERGAKVNTVKSVERTTALHYACCNDRSARCVSLLIAAGANVNASNWDWTTPLHWAACNDNEPAVRALLAAGAGESFQRTSRSFKCTPFDLARSASIRNLLRS